MTLQKVEVFEAACDGCQDRFEDGEGIIYFPDRAQAVLVLTDSDWAVADDDSVLCFDCHGREPAEPAP